MNRIKSLAAIAILALALLGTSRPASAGAQPDLAIRNVHASFISGQWYMVYTVNNIGTAATGDFRITTRSRAGTITSNFMTGGLAAGAVRTYYHQAGAICEFYRSIWADSSNLIDESNEINNRTSFENLC